MTSLDRKHRVVASYPKWRATGLGIPRGDPLDQEMVIRELELPVQEWGNYTRFSDNTSNRVRFETSDLLASLRKELIETVARGIFEEGQVPQDLWFDIKDPADPLSQYKAMGLKFYTIFGGQIDNYIANLHKKLRDLDIDYAQHKRAIKSRGLLDTLKDWLLWTIQRWKT